MFSPVDSLLVSDIACIDRFVDDIAHQQVLVVVLSIVTQQECVEFVPRSTVQISAILAEWCFFHRSGSSIACMPLTGCLSGPVR